MIRESAVIGATILMIVLATSANSLYAQNGTTNASRTGDNMTTSANHSASDLGQNTTAINRTELAQNASAVMNQSGISLGEVGKNASDVGGNILNTTGETAKKIGEGAAGVLGNISGEIKKGINGNSSK